MRGSSDSCNIPPSPPPRYTPETKAEKNARIAAAGEAKAAGSAAKSGTPTAVLKFGLNHVTTLIEQKKAKLVAIASDVAPLEVLWLLCRVCAARLVAAAHLCSPTTSTLCPLAPCHPPFSFYTTQLVVWLPALCRKMEIPFVIVKNKARLGQLTNQKTSAVVALTAVRSEVRFAVALALALPCITPVARDGPQ